MLNGCVWQIDTVPTDSLPQSVEEKAVLEMIEAEPNPFNETKNGTQAEPEIETVLANSHDL